MESETTSELFLIETDGRVVWVNGQHGLLGRFSPTGIDVHVNGKCKDDSCVTEYCTPKHWRDFQQKMMIHHGIDVADEYAPTFVRGAVGHHLDLIKKGLVGIVDNSNCPDPGNGGCVGGPIPELGCVHEAARTALRAFEELTAWGWLK